MFDRLDLFREDTPTPAPPPRPAREDAPRADQARPGAPGQDSPAREDRARDEPRAGHRREHDARELASEARQRSRRTITERKRERDRRRGALSSRVLHRPLRAAF